MSWEAQNGYYRARLRVMGADEGGRSHPVFTGYRATWAISAEEDQEHIVQDAPLVIEGHEQITPGGEGTVRLHPLHPEYWADVRTGTPLLMKEGHRTIGTATVLERVEPSE